MVIFDIEIWNYIYLVILKTVYIYIYIVLTKLKDRKIRVNVTNFEAYLLNEFCSKEILRSFNNITKILQRSSNYKNNDVSRRIAHVCYHYVSSS